MLALYTNESMRAVGELYESRTQQCAEHATAHHLQRLL
jgi:hypothetical protein